MTIALPQNQLPEELTQRVADLADAGVSTPVVLIDGRAASGKSTLAASLQNLLFKELQVAPRLVHMDDLYEGWTGLQAGSDYLHRSVLLPVSRRQVANWQEYNWQLGARERWREFGGGTPLIVEGCGSLSRAASELAQVKVWLEVPLEVRQARWLEREGNKFDDQWPVWAAQEVEFYARERSDELADFIGS